MVKSLHVSYLSEKKKKKTETQERHDFLPKGDFSLAGLSLGQRFKDYSFMEWERKMMNPGEEIWYYEGYGVRMTKKEHWIMAFFLTDDRMLTPRGLAMGDDQSTAEMLLARHKSWRWIPLQAARAQPMCTSPKGRRRYSSSISRIKKWMASCAPGIHSGESDLSLGTHF